MVKGSIQDMVTGKLTAEQFEQAVAAFPRLSDAGKAAAQSVLVDGLSQSDVAADLGIHRQQVNKWVREIYESYLGCPDGWRVEVVMLPADQMEQVKAMEKEARKAIRKREKGKQ